MVMVSPVVPPLPVKVGDVSLVMLSVELVPVSDEASRSGALDGVTGGFVIVNGNELDANDVFPAGSVSVPVTVHEPVDNVGRSHDVADPIVYVQLTVVEPFVALMVAVSPVVPPLETENVGVVSVVLLSVLEFPVSDEAARSGAPGADGAVVSTTTLVAALAAETFPYVSVVVAEMLHVPAVSAGRSHEVSGSTYVQVFVVPPLVAETVMVSPTFPPAAETVGVVSFVMLSVGELPVSDAAARAGAVGADGFGTMVSPSVVPADETLPAVSVRVALVVHEPALSVGRSHDVADPIV